MSRRGKGAFSSLLASSATGADPDASEDLSSPQSLQRPHAAVSEQARSSSSPHAVSHKEGPSCGLDARIEEPSPAVSSTAPASASRRTDAPWLGPWRVCGVLGRGHQGAIVFLTEGPDDDNCPAAVKFPVDREELEMYRLVEDLPAVPDLLDSGETEASGPQWAASGLPVQRGLFMAMPVVQPSLDELLRGPLDFDGRGGRLSWTVAQGLGLYLVKALQSIHERGLLHCDIKPGNVLLLPTEPWLQVIDFGRAGLCGEVNFPTGHGGMRDYMSVKAGTEGGERSPGDDLESIGWLLLRAILGAFPWKAKAKEREDETWEDGSRRVSAAKLRFLDDASLSSFPSHFRCCPEELRAFLREARGLSKDTASCVDYHSLYELLRGSNSDAEATWQRFTLSCSGMDAPVPAPAGGGGTPVQTCFSGWPPVAVVQRSPLLWRPSEAPGGWPGRPGADVEIAVPRGTGLRVTGRCWRERAAARRSGRLWMELEPVWLSELSPNTAAQLLRPGWLMAEGPPQESQPWILPVEFPAM